jgi:hypothetical protein
MIRTTGFAAITLPWAADLKIPQPWTAGLFPQPADCRHIVSAKNTIPPQSGQSLWRRSVRPSMCTFFGAYFLKNLLFIEEISFSQD